MVPSSIQWTMTPSVHILVYPISKYVISPVKKSFGTTVKRLIQDRKTKASQTSSLVRRCRKSRVHRLPENCSNHQYRRSQQHRHMQTYPKKRSSYHRPNYSKPRCEKRCRFRDTCSGLGSIHCQGKQVQDQNDEQDEDMESEEEEKEDDEDAEEEEKEEDEDVEVEDCDYDGDDDNFDDEDYDEDEDEEEEEEEEEDDNEDEFKDLVLGRKRKRLDDVNDSGGSVARVVPTIDDAITCWGPQPLISDKINRVTRCSANVVLLAHGNRSLYVLTIQRNQVISIASKLFTCYRSHRSSSTTMISYKLPGGQFILTEDESQNNQKNSRNTCTCPDDQQWYSAGINHFITQLTV
ncbi:YTH domain-containing protein 1-like [Rhopalosiphum maidis]|uniref:YTH domain-containing protein 1-like n=1 Tax=Rhopalosiphum maidis TaxID=43146 RepID=UPI000EFF1A3F|nr:YTH domain-containing protein 1-like [Rhopalosiphum maidis]